jgi:hypothetical protein
MGTVESLLRALVAHPRRGLFVIILTSGLGLVTLWPVVDEYFVLLDDCARTELSIVEAQQEIATIDQIRRLSAGQKEELEKQRKKMLVVEDVHQFSSKLVELTRNAGCQLRRVDLGEPQKRRWFEGDHPLHPQPPVANAKETPFELRTQRVALSITGPMDRVQAFLGELHALDKVVHTQSIQLKPATDERSEVNLDLELLFFDLKRAKKSEAA